jgi:proteasome accessory factor BC
MAMRDDDKLVRQLSLVAFLMSQHRPVTADEIHENVEGYGGMSEQAFLRRFYSDRSELEAMGFSLTVERPGDDPFQGDLYALPPESYYLPPIDFDEGELSALQTCLYLLEGQFAYAEPLRLALQHLTLGRPSPLDDHAARTVAVNLLGPNYSTDVATYLTKIESAIGRRKTIRFSYYSIGRDERAQREVDPYSLLYAAGNWYMVGHSHERQDTRIFRLSRIEGRITFKSRAEHDFPPPPDFDLSPYRDRAPWQLAEPNQEATLALTSTIAWWVEQMFGRHGTFEAQADGTGVFTTPYGSKRELLTWILGLGADAEVLGPPDLRAAAVDALELVRDRHTAEPEAREVPATTITVSVSEQRSTASSGPATAPDRVVPAERFTRLLALMTRLLAACGRSRDGNVPCVELRTGLNLSQRELEDDLGLLNLINFGGGCYALFAQVVDDAVSVQKETYGEQFSRPARLSPLEAKALLWALEFIGDRLPIGTDDPLASAREKIEAAIGEDRLPPIELGRVQTANSAVAAAVTRAIREDRVVEIDYWTEARGAITSRAIEPHLLVNTRDAWYVVSWCRRAEEQRTFRLDRIRSARVTKERFERRPAMTAGPYLPWGDRPQHPGGTLAQSASVWCSPSVARWLEEEHPSSERHSDGSVLVEIPYASEAWLVKELIKHQGEAVLFEPPAARRVVAKEAESILKRYRTRRRQAQRTTAQSSSSRRSG